MRMWVMREGRRSALRRRVAGVVLPFLMGAGCAPNLLPRYSVTPMAVADGERIENLERRPERILLVLDEELRTFVSNDRGHWAADPQEYRIGPAIEHLAKEYFEASFTDVVSAEVPPHGIATGDWDFVVKPGIVRFDNSLAFFSATQTLQIDLRAEVCGRDASGCFEARGSALRTHSVNRVRTSERKVARPLTDMLEAALSELTIDVQHGIGSAPDVDR